jgi:ferrous iron transport protein A
VAVSEGRGDRLDKLAVGERGRVVSMSPGCVLCLRLLEHGMTPGCEFTVTKVAPFGGPVEIEVRGTRVCMRSCEANLICIEPLEPQGP